jgi:uncharacterized protein YfaS (alpha-2-macroglobulin family)
LALTDSNNQLVASLNFFVAGESNLTLSLDKSAELDLKLNKREFTTGEEIEINIITPYIGSGLITIERDRVYAYKWFTATQTSSRQTIRIPETLEGNGYVNVSFVRSPTSREVFISPHSYAVAPFSLNTSNHAIGVTLDVPAEVRPGMPLRIGYTANRSGKIVVYAVDEGILQVANYQNPNPLSAFFQKRALQVNTFQMLDLILSDSRAIREAAGIGGDFAYEMARAAMMANINPFRRITEAPVVFWSGIMDVSANQRTYVTYNVPQYFNGALRVMAVAVNTDSMGVAVGQALIRSPIILQPSFPVSLAPADRAILSVVVANNIDGSGEAEINIDVRPDEYFKIIGDTRKTITLREGNEGVVEFNIEATGKLGSGTLNIAATSAKLDSRPINMAATASIRPPTLHNTILTVGVSDGQRVSIADFSRDMHDEFAERNVVASHSPMLIARGLTQDLKHQPHGKTEQIVSRSFPALYLRGTFISNEEAQQYHEATLNALRSRQLHDGSFGVWASARARGDIYTTIYALHYLTDARERGFHVPEDLLRNGIRFLRNHIAKPLESENDAREKAYAAYVLTRNGVVTTAFLANLEEYFTQTNVRNWRNGITAVYMAAIYKMMKMDERADSMIRAFTPDTTSRFVFFSDFDTSSLRNATYLYILGKHFPDMAGNVDTKIILNLIDSIAAQHYNSILSAYTILALASISASMEGHDADIKISLETPDNKSVELKGSYNVRASRITAESPRQGGLGLFIVASESGFDRNIPARTSQGIEIFREYLDASGAPKRTFNQGDDVFIRLRVRTNGNMPNINSVAIVDMLPGAFEIQVDSIPELRQRVDHVDVREDRLIFYAPITQELREFNYRARVVGRGEFVIPPAYAQAIYDPVYRGNTEGGKLQTGDRF